MSIIYHKYDNHPNGVLKLINTIKMLMNTESGWSEGSLAQLGTWQLTLMIAGPVCVVCLAVMLALSLWTHHRKQRDPYTYPPEVDGPDQPILGAVSLRDMIDMTTSGSGSGK